jgi:hypothetical protein
MIMSVQVIVFWNVILCGLIDTYQHLGGIGCFIFIHPEGGGSSLLYSVSV